MSTITRLLFLAISAGLVASSVGCTMCCSPFDYCYPVFDDCSSPKCGFNPPREGSIVSGGVMMADDGTVVHEGVPVAADVLQAPLPEEQTQNLYHGGPMSTGQPVRYGAAHPHSKPWRR